jgi:biotin operon repressor
MVGYRGYDRRIAGADLAAKLGISERELRDVVNAALDNGHPIVALFEGGYYYAMRREEIEHPVRQLRSMSKKLKEKADRMEAAAEKVFGPPTLFGGGGGLAEG